MGQSTIILLMILVIGLLGKAYSVAVAAAIMLCIQLFETENYLFSIIEKNGLFLGLVLLTCAILVPIAKGDINFQNLQSTFSSKIGIMALLLSLFTTYLSGLGLQYLNVESNAGILPAMIIGSVIAATFLGGVPVGPLISSGMLALLTKSLFK